MRERVLSFLLLSILVVSLPIGVYADDTQGTGILTVSNSPISVLSRSIAEGEGESNITSGSLPVNTYFWFRVTAFDSNTMKDVENITVYVYASTGTVGLFDKQKSYGFQWRNESGTHKWYELLPGGWTQVLDVGTYLDASSSVEPPDSSMAYGMWKFKVKFAKVAIHTEVATEWRFNATAYDGDGKDSIDDTGWFEFAYYKEFTVSAADISWETLNPGLKNQTAAGMPRTITVVAINHNTDIKVRGSGDLIKTDGGGTTFPLSNVYVGQTDSVANNDGVKLDITYNTIWDNIPAGTEGADKNTYWFITVPCPCVAGTYIFTWYVALMED